MSLATRRLIVSIVFFAIATWAASRVEAWWFWLVLVTLVAIGILVQVRGPAWLTRAPMPRWGMPLIYGLTMIGVIVLKPYGMQTIYGAIALVAAATAGMILEGWRQARGDGPRQIEIS